jgi:ADP-ribosylglycohydrolase
MLGAIAGDVIGSVYEWRPIKSTEFPLFSSHNTFTDDSVLTVAVAEALLQGSGYAAVLQAYYQRYPHAGYGGSFQNWASSGSSEPYNSWGNGSAMRVSPVGWARDTLEEVLAEAQRSAEVTHNHPEGIKGAQATAGAVFLARTGHSKEAIQATIAQRFGYDLDTPLDVIRPGYTFDVSCQGSVPQAIRAFLEAADYEDTVRQAISLGGDSDTQAAIAGGIAEAFYGGVPEHIATQVWNNALDEPLREVVRAFRAAYGPAGAPL